LFWTIPIKPSSVNVEADAQTAVMKLRELPVEDYFNFFNALVDGPSNEAEVTFTVNWSGFIKEDKIVDPTNDFRAKLVEDSAWVEWIAKSEDVTYRSVGDPTTVVFAEFGRERNGVFFP
jgi:hypothetical protein